MCSIWVKYNFSVIRFDVRKKGKCVYSRKLRVYTPQARNWMKTLKKRSVLIREDILKIFNAKSVFSKLIQHGFRTNRHGTYGKISIRSETALTWPFTVWFSAEETLPSDYSVFFACYYFHKTRRRRLCFCEKHAKLKNCKSMKGTRERKSLPLLCENTLISNVSVGKIDMR